MANNFSYKFTLSPMPGFIDELQKQANLARQISIITGIPEVAIMSAARHECMRKPAGLTEVLEYRLRKAQSGGTNG